VVKRLEIAHVAPVSINFTDDMLAARTCVQW